MTNPQHGPSQEQPSSDDKRPTSQPERAQPAKESEEGAGVQYVDRGGRLDRPED